MFQFNLSTRFSGLLTLMLINPIILSSCNQSPTEIGSATRQQLQSEQLASGMSMAMVQNKLMNSDRASILSFSLDSLKDIFSISKQGGTLKIDRKLFDADGTVIGNLNQTLIAEGSVSSDSFGNIVQRKSPVVRTSPNISVFDNSRKSPVDAVGSIIVLKEKSELELRAELKLKKVAEPDIARMMLEQRKIIQLQQDRIKAKIARLSSSVLASPYVTKRKGYIRVQEFKKSINAIAVLDIPLTQAKVLLQNDPDTKNVFANSVVKADLVQSVPQINVNQLWSTTSSTCSLLDGTGMRIGVIDTGADYTHADLGGCMGVGCKVLGGWDFVNNDSNPMDDHGHGTHVASTVAGNGIVVQSGTTVPIRGTAPGASLFIYKVLSSAGTGMSSWIIGSIDTCADPNGDGDYSDHLDVCSMSLGAQGGNPDDPMSMAVDNVVLGTDVVFTVAAGNSGPASHTIGSPGTAREALTVAASCKSGDIGSDPTCSNPIANFSSVGPVTWTNGSGVTQTLSKPDVSAPGHKICAAQWGTYQSSNACGAGHIAISGTSMATPHVAGLAAILRQANSSLTAQQIKQVLMSTATNLGQPSARQGTGEVSAMAALQATGMGSCALAVAGAPVTVIDDVSQLNQTFAKTITITNNGGSALTLSPSFINAPAGITASFSQPSYSIAANSTQTVNVNFNIDHSILNTPGYHSGIAKFSYGGANNLSVNVTFLVDHRVSTNLPLVDLGMDDPALTTANLSGSIQVINHIQNAPQTYTVQITCCNTGSSGSNPNISVSAPSSITLSPGQTYPLNFNVTISNSIPSGMYYGTLKLINPRESLELPIRFFKGYGFRVHYGPLAELALVDMKNQSTGAVNNFIFQGPGSSLILVTNNTAYDFVGNYFFEQNTDPMNVYTAVVRESVIPSPTVTDVYLRRTDATVESMMVPIDETGSHVSFMPSATWGYSQTTPTLSNMGRMFATWFIPSGNGLKMMTNTFTPLFQIDLGFSSYFSLPVRSYDYFYKGITGNSNRTNLPTEVVLRNLVNVQNVQLGTPTTINPFNCVVSMGGSMCGSGGSGIVTSGLNPTPMYSVGTGLGYIQDLGWSFIAHNFMTKVGSNWETVSDKMIFDMHKTFVFRNPSMNYLNSPNIAQVMEVVREPAPLNKVLMIGGGPFYDASKWANFGYLGLRYADDATFLSHTGGSSIISPLAPANYQMLQNGSVTGSGTLANYWGFIPSPAYLNAPALMQFKVNQQSTSVGTTVELKTDSDFNAVSINDHYNNPVDSNPPRIRNVRLIGNNIVQSVVDNSIANKIVVEIDPNPGLSMSYAQLPDSLTAKGLSVSADGITFSPVALTQVSGNVFESAAIPNLTTNLYHFKVTATDAANNHLNTIFQMPSGNAISGSVGVGPEDEIPFTPTPTPTPVPVNPLNANANAVPGCTNNSGSINLSVSGGVPGYTYAWTGPGGFTSSDQNPSGLVSGNTYTVLVTDSTGATTTASATIPAAANVNVTGVVTNASGGLNNGAINITPTGTGPYSFTWSSGSGYSSSLEDISGLAPGVYSVTVFNTLGCKASNSFTVYNNMSLSHTVQQQCNWDSANINLTVNGGTPGYTYSWTKSGSTWTSSVEDPVNVTTGTYYVTVTDSLGQQVLNYAVPVTITPPIAVTPTINHATAPNYNNGSISLSVTGGLPPYTYLWSNGATTPSITNLIANQNVGYNVLVTDSRNCTKSVMNMKITKKLTVATWVGNSCLGGTAPQPLMVATPSGGQAPYTYQWVAQGTTTPVLATSASPMLPPGNYSVIVTDSGVGLLNQVVTANATMTPTIPTIGISGVITNATGPNYNNGAINVTVTPTDTYTYQWSTGQTTEDIANQTAGVRTITVKNPYQCKATKSFTIQKKLIILNPTQ